MLIKTERLGFVFYVGRDAMRMLDVEIGIGFGYRRPASHRYMGTFAFFVGASWDWLPTLHYERYPPPPGFHYLGGADSARWTGRAFKLISWRWPFYSRWQWRHR